ncbi:MAG: TonB-dependent receptor [Pseudohongiella sp.]|nr:TonB-dependent receptor [Pseudohongiella sp.]
MSTLFACKGKRAIFRKNAWVLTGLLSSASCLTAFAQTTNQASNQTAEEREVEEVIVTGSYLRGSPLDAPSPVQVVDRASIEAQGASQIWDVIKNLEINSGSITNEGTDGGNAAMGNLSGTANVNLRNLGENSTLTLINGKRQVAAATTTPTGGEFVDINTIPLVMVERLEVLTDGGSALYGSDAVAGAVNVIMRTEFEGLEIYGDIQAIAKEAGKQDRTVSAIWGWASDSGETHFVLAGEIFQRDPVPITAARYFDEKSEFNGTVGGLGTVISNAAFGSRVNNDYLNRDVMAQRIAEGGSATNLYTDPACFTQTSADGTPFFVGTRTSARGSPSAACRENSYEWSLLSVGMERESIAGAFNHSFSDKAEFYSFAQYSKSDIQRADSGVYTSRGPTMFLAQPGAHVGNLITALGAPASYSPGRYGELGSMAHLVGLTPPVNIPNAPIAGYNGGINVPMYGNIVIGNTPRTGASNNMNKTETIGIQAGIKGEFFAMNDRRFNYDVGYSWSGTSFELEYKTFIRDRAELAANGLGGPNCTPNGRADFDFVGQGPRHPAAYTNAINLGRSLGALTAASANGLRPTFWDNLGGSMTQTFFPGFVFTTRESLSLALTSNNQGQGGCQFYNPFMTQMTNPALANSQELIDWMLPTVRRTDKRNKLGVIDAVLAGELFEMQGGVAQMAVGAQYRMQNNKSIAPTINLPGLPNAILGYDSNGVPNRFHYVSNNYECAQCIFNYDHDREVKAVFAEFSLPFWNRVESQLAVRYEDYGGTIGGELTPKVALSWRPVDDLLLRASFSQSFRAPNIGVQLEGLEASSTTFRDPIRNIAVRSGLLEANNTNAQPNTTYTAGSPAPDIGNEYANTYSTGFIWTPGGRLDGLSVNADFWRFEVEDRVMPQPGIASIAHEIEAFNAVVGNTNNYVINGTIPSSPSGVYEGLSPYTPCDPVALAARDGTDPDSASNRNASGATVPFSRLDCVVDPRSYVVPGVVRTTGSTTAGLTTIQFKAINAGEVISDGVDLKLGYRWSTDYGRIRAGMDFTYVNQYKLKDVPGLELGLRETGLFDAAGTTGDGLLVRSLPDKKGNITLNWSSNSLTHSVTVITRFIGSYSNLQYQDTFDNGNDYVRSIVNRKISSYSSVDLQYNYVHEWANTSLGTSVFTVGMLDAFNAVLPFHYNGTLNYDAAAFDGRGRRLYARALLQF